ncbi:HigA family addiction module antitoxin [Asticcacaulis sp. DXS10W]|uniref:HigA family addiction module antitoxin n=1 Tax=Asticcacaulis currens TaxID=2984210 RepID=A0ABT5IDJ3_9CAUL|nr:HigA family addiction module antitoxin [Asticcacaulis currens]MDC7694275.1 HigA family addiction module antitoxin [Asticcacaulis currens]
MEREPAPAIAIATPGDILLEELLTPMNISVEVFADQIGQDRHPIDGFVKGEHRFEPDVFISFDRALGLSDGYWSNVQFIYDTRMTKKHTE